MRAVGVVLVFMVAGSLACMRVRTPVFVSMDVPVKPFGFGVRAVVLMVMFASMVMVMVMPVFMVMLVSMRVLVLVVMPVSMVMITPVSVVVLVPVFMVMVVLVSMVVVMLVSVFMVVFVSMVVVMLVSIGATSERMMIALVHGATGSACRAPRDNQRTTAMAAPKPLSILTTVTPAAQLDNIPSSAARPPRDAP
jgi:hypothetical protein